MTTLHIAENLKLPIEAITQTFAILAKRGVGKTYTAMVMAEEMLKAEQQIVVVDPIGVWWGLRAASNGKDPGLPIIVFGGEHGDVPLEESAGEIIASAIVQGSFSAVLDLGLLRKAAQVRFMTAFAETLYRLNRRPLHVFVDEADAFAPQRPMPGEQRLLGSFEDIGRRGRARGLGMTLITQRAAVLNKNVLTQIEVLVCLRTIAPQDRDAIDAWIEVHGTPKQREELMASLPSLPIGVAWFWSPGWLDLFRRVAIRKRETFDSSATPEVGGKALAPVRLAPVDLDKLSAEIKATVQRTKENDPAALKKTITELKRELAHTAPAKVERVNILNEADFSRWNDCARNMAKVVEDFGEALRDFSERLEKAHRLGHMRPVGRVEPARFERAMLREFGRPAKAGTPNTAIVSTGGVRRMLVALAQCPEGLSARQLGVRAGLSSSSGSFGTYLGSLRSSGFVEGSRERLVITESGLRSLGEWQPLPSGPDLLKHWLNELGGGAARILHVLAEHYPRSLDAEELGTLAGLSSSSGSFGTYLGKLRTLELVSGPRSALRASEEFFQ